MDKKTYNVVDLFAGAGGLSLGFSQTKRFSIVAAAENNPYARKTYLRNHKGTRLYSDVRTIDYSELLESFGDVDVVIGGPPCQGFSNANRQHSTLVSMNNRLVKEYVRAICELRPKVFVMENVAMLKSHLHRFIVDESDLLDQRIMALDLQEDLIELIPSNCISDETLAFLTGETDVKQYIWANEFYKIINLLYRNRINQPKFDKALSKYKVPLFKKLNLLVSQKTSNVTSISYYDTQMAKAILSYADSKVSFENVISNIEKPLMIQKMILKKQEIADYNIHVFEYKKENGALFALVKSYAVLDYIKGILENKPYCYKLTPNVLNALDYGAPQRRERFVIVGVSNSIEKEYAPPKPTTNGGYHTVRQAIEDLKSIQTSTDVDVKPTPLKPLPDDKVTELTKALRGKLLHNHVVTATKDTALERFKSLKAGQNFHDLDASLKTTYSNAARTQNTIYMRLNYDEPCGTVVNVRKSMWIHPELDRAISIREAARLQTFPDTFVFEGSKDAQYQQIGNAVPPFLAKAIAKSVLKVLDSLKTE